MFLEKWKKDKFQPQKVPTNISEKNQTTAMYRKTFMASYSVSSVAITTATFQMARN